LQPFTGYGEKKSWAGRKTVNNQSISRLNAALLMKKQSLPILTS
jgi:hypothetical protein